VARKRRKSTKTHKRTAPTQHKPAPSKQTPTIQPKPAPTVHKKRHFPKRILIIFFVILTPLLLGYVGYGYITRPIVEYSFGGASVVRSSYRLDPMSTTEAGTVDLVEVKVQNVGQSDISVIITLNAMNAEVASSHDGPYDLNTGIQVTLPANSDYRFVPFYLTLLTQVTTFKLTCKVSNVPDYSTFSSSTASTFGEVDPLPFTTLQYAQQPSAPTDSYQLIQQS